MNKTGKTSVLAVILACILTLSGWSTYSVRAADKPVAEVSAGAVSRISLGKPGISVSVKQDRMTVTVRKTENAEGYLVYIKAENEKKYVLSGSIEKNGKAKRRFVLDGLAAGKYYVKVRAYAGNDLSDFSKVHTVSVEKGISATHDEILASWNSDAPALQQIVSYMQAVTTEGSKDYIPVENRIAVFDLDGTLYCETDPNYFDHLLLMHRVLEDADYKEKASEFEKKVAADVIVMNETGVQAENMEVNHGTAVASSFKGFTPEEFYDYIAEYKKTPMNSYEGMTLGEAFYRPMLEIVEYLKANDFTVYIVSGTDRFIVRGLVKDSKLDLPFNNIIGSDETVVASGQSGSDGLSYVFNEDDRIVFGGDFIVKNLKMNKVSVIVQEIGVQPVLSFGNSTGDSSMAEYVTTGNPYRSLAFMLCCDDTERENGNEAKAQKMYGLCEEFGWTPISMKNDWKTIYGEDVKKVR